MTQGRKVRSWVALGLGLGGLVAFVSILHVVSPILPGSSGKLLYNNLSEEIDASALLYTESGDVSDYLDTVNGKYGGRMIGPDPQE